MITIFSYLHCSENLGSSWKRWILWNAKDKTLARGKQCCLFSSLHSIIWSWENWAFPLRQSNTIKIICSLTISRSGFFYRASKVWNQLPATLRNEVSIPKSRFGLRKWILLNVPRKLPWMRTTPPWCLQFSFYSLFLFIINSKNGNLFFSKVLM